MNDEIRLLSRIRGQIDNLLTHSMSGRVSGGALDTVQSWAFVYTKHGLGFSTCPDDTGILRSLTAAGFLAADGKTKSQAHRLTWRGIVASMPEGGDGPHDIVAYLALLAALPTHDLTAIQAVEGFRLAPEAVTFCRTGRNADAYRNALATVRMSLTPLLAMGWARLIVDRTGRLWAATITEGGRQALQSLPDCDIKPATHNDFDSWEAGFNEADQYATRPPPTWTKNYLSRMLGTGCAWSRIVDYTATKARNELKGARTQAAAMLP